MPQIQRNGSRRRRTGGARGQGLVEFALVAPVLLLILLLALDFGRAFYSWINLQNASRIGANFAALNTQAGKVPAMPPSGRSTLHSS